MSWEPIRVEDLRIGHCIRLDHSWFQHPFLRSTFTISSLSEIEIIRRDGLTRLRVDPERSKVAAAAVPYDRPAAMPEQVRRSPQFLNTVSADHQALLDAKQLRVTEARAMQRALAELSFEREEALIDCTECLRLLQAGRGEGFEMAQSLATRYSESTARTTQFGLVHWDDGAIAYDPQSASALDIALFASSAARVLGLEHSEQQLLISAALLLSVQQMRPPSAPAAGLKPEPSPVRSNARNVDEVRRRVALLRETGDRSPRLLRLVEQHRERLDGSGTPKGLTSADIDPLAMVLAACSEYRRLVSGSDAVSPSRALALLYLQHQQTLGRPAVEAVVAALTVYPPGTCVDLSDGTAGLVIRSDRNEKLRPTVMLLPEEGTDEEAHEIVDLQAQRTISVRRVLDGPEIDRARLQRIVPGSAWSAAPWPQAEVAAAAP